MSRGPYASYASHHGVAEPETLAAFAYELIEDALSKDGIDDGFELAELISVKQKFNPAISTKDSQIVLSRVSEISDHLITHEAAEEAKNVVGLKGLINSSLDQSMLGSRIRSIGNEFLTRFNEEHEFESESSKQQFLDAIDINLYHDKFQPKPEELIIALKHGEMKHIEGDVAALSSLPRKTSTDALIALSENNNLEASVAKDDLTTFIGYLGKLDDSKIDTFISNFLENRTSKHVEFAESFLDYEQIKDNMIGEKSFRESAAELGIPPSTANKLENVDPEYKPLTPTYAMDFSPGFN